MCFGSGKRLAVRAWVGLWRCLDAACNQHNNTPTTSRWLELQALCKQRIVHCIIGICQSTTCKQFIIVLTSFVNLAAPTSLVCYNVLGIHLLAVKHDKLFCPRSR